MLNCYYHFTFKFILDFSSLITQLSDSYQRVYEALSVELVKDYVPDSWIALVQVKSQYYKATAHQMVGSGLVAGIDGRPLSLKTKETLTFMYTEDERVSGGGETRANSTSNLNFTSSKPSKDKVSTIIDIRVPKNGAEQLQLGNRKKSFSISFLAKRNKQTKWRMV